jgi:fumarylacetoacetate (FAA) hydrolase
MKLVSINYEGKDKIALLIDSNIYPVFQLNASLADNMAAFLEAGEDAMEVLRKLEDTIRKNPRQFNSYSVNKQPLLAPVPYPSSCRDGYAFRQHVETARRNRGVPMIPEFDQYPVFYFTNHHSIFGPGEIKLMPDHFQKLDFELEAAIVIGKKGRNIKAEEADDYIAGYMIMNDLSARTLQMEEMMLNLGPAKGKDFATVIGPWMVTPDELEEFRVPTKEGHTGLQYGLKMKAYVNGEQVSEGNMGQMDWTFAEIIERASYGVDLYPGDVIGSGTVGTGCFLELNGTGKLNNPDYKAQWLEDGDTIELEIEGLGRLKNSVRQIDTDYSLLNRKKK